MRRIIGREKTPTPKTRVSIRIVLRTPGRFTTRPLPAYFTTKMSVVRPFLVLSKDEIGPHSKTGRFLSKAEILGVGVVSPLPISVLVRKGPLGRRVFSGVGRWERIKFGPV